MPRQAAVEYVPLAIDNRVTLPKHFCDLLPWLAGKAIEAWLYVLEPGRYRLVSDENLENDSQLEPLRLFVLQDSSKAPQQPSTAMNSQDAASVSRLIPVTVERHKGSWRMLLPEQATALRPRDCNPRALAVCMPEGYIEIWYADFLQTFLKPAWPR